MQTSVESFSSSWDGLTQAMRKQINGIKHQNNKIQDLIDEIKDKQATSGNPVDLDAIKQLLKEELKLGNNTDQNASLVPGNRSLVDLDTTNDVMADVKEIKGDIKAKKNADAEASKMKGQLELEKKAVD